MPFTSVTAHIDPYSRVHDTYQAYYRSSISTFCSEDAVAYHEAGNRCGGLLRFLRRVKHSARFQKLAPGEFGTKAIDGIARLLGAKIREPETAVGCYQFYQDSRELRVSIDAHDTGLVARPDLLEWCDLYLKANFWPDLVYSPKVAPIAFLNPSVLEKQAQLKNLRNTKKELDLFVFFRVWGGPNEIEGVEHNLRLLETLARVKCRKKLLAYLLTGEIRTAVARLEKAGVPWTTKWVPQAELWRLAAKSTLNIVRHGMHQCVPWRMAEILAMGGCPVLDYSATTRWHVPLEEGVHYLNLGVPYRPNGAADFDSYEVIDRVERWVASEGLTQTISRNTASYFDEHLTPQALGRYIALQVANVADRSYPRGRILAGNS